MQLFDTVVSADMGPANYGESHYEYLSRTGRPPFLRVRELMEIWLAEFPRQHRAEIATRLRTRDNRHFDAAFFELYLHALVRRLGYVVRVHPRAGGRKKRPDFLITEAGQCGLLIEAASVTDTSAFARAEESRRHAVYDALNRFHCPDYFINLQHYGELTSNLPGARLRRELRQFINSLDYDAVRKLAEHGLEHLPKYSFVHDSFRLEISLIPVSPERRGQTEHRPLGMHGPAEGALVDYHTPIRDKISHKANYYGRLRRPLVVAINVASGHADNIDVMQALFGTERWTYPTLSGVLGEPRFGRALDGVFVGPKGPRNRNVSAVLLVSALLPWTVATSEPVIYQNPWARNPTESLPESIIQFRPDRQRMVPGGGSPVHKILNLKQGWPHFDQS
jgi:hypothetical protein